MLFVFRILPNTDMYVICAVVFFFLVLYLKPRIPCKTQGVFDGIEKKAYIINNKLSYVFDFLFGRHFNIGILFRRTVNIFPCLL